MQAILHIGQQKTGSTALQFLLKHNFKTLINDYKILYPKSFGKNKQVILFKYSEGLLYQVENLVNNFNKELSQYNPNKIIFSEENLFALNDTRKKNIYQFLSRYFNNIQIIVYLRKQEEHILSHYQQHVRDKEVLALDAYIYKSLRGDYYNYNKIVSSWGDVFGMKNIQIRTYGNLINQDIRHDFLNILQIPHNVIDFKKNIKKNNEGIDGVSVEIIRILNQLEVSGKDIPHMLKRKIRKCLKAKPRGKKITLSYEQKQILFEYTVDSNQRLCTKFNLSDLDREYLSKPIKNQNETWSNEDIDKEEIVKILYQLLFSKSIHE